MDIIGRLHPLIIHLPIGILMLAILMEASIRFMKKHELRQSLSFVLGVGALSSVFAVITGLNLSENGDYNMTLLSRHQWCAIAMTGFSIIAWWQHRKFQNNSDEGTLYLPAMAGIGLLMAVTGHLGGSMTHGADFLTAGKSSSEPIKIVDMRQAIAFTDIIHPIMNQKCNSCHNPSKAKGDLIMTTKEGILKGGKEGPILLAGFPLKSNFLKRAHLPMTEKEHMPPKGKKQLTTDEIALFKWWIKEEASFDKKIAELNVPDSIQLILNKYQQVESDFAAIDVDPASESKIQALREKGIKVNKLGEGSPWLDVNLSYRQDITSDLLKELKKVSEQISELQLASTNVDDQLASVISRVPNLRKLKLQNSQITNDVISELKDLKHLESLNLYGTSVNDEIIEDLQNLSSLKQLYLWKTEMSEAGVAALQKEKPLLKIQYKLDADLFGDALLKAPMITAGADIFKDTLTIELNLNFKNVKLHYTVDGSDPDSTSSIYTGPITIHQSTQIKAIAMKEGWESSEVVDRQFVKSSIEAKSIAISPKPHEKYAGKGATSLIDFVKGSTQFTDGKWLGYENQHMSSTIILEEMTEIKAVTVSALKADASYIHYPRSITVSLSKDGQKFNKAGSIDIPVATGSTPAALKNFLVKLDASQAKFIKIDIKSQLVNPDWHSAPGAACWMFIDEILVEA